MNHPIVVEFLGLPAAGKSTIASELKNQLEAEGMDVTNTTYDITHGSRSFVHRYITMIGYAVVTLIINPMKSIQILRTIVQSNQRSYTDTIRLWLYSLYLCYLMKRPLKKSGVHLLDQGPYQACWSVALSSNEPAIANLIELLPLFGIPVERHLVVVQVSPETALNRLEKRDTNTTRFEKLSQTKTDAEEMSDIIDDLVKGTPNASNSVHTVSGEGTTASTVADELAPLIDEIGQPD